MRYEFHPEAVNVQCYNTVQETNQLKFEVEETNGEVK